MQLKYFKKEFLKETPNTGEPDKYIVYSYGPCISLTVFDLGEIAVTSYCFDCFVPDEHIFTNEKEAYDFVIETYEDYANELAEEIVEKQLLYNKIKELI